MFLYFTGNVLLNLLFCQGPQKFRSASVMVREEWKVVEEMDFPRLSKLSLPNVEDPDDL